MATKRMLIDASHPEETRVVVVDGSRVEDYDVEVASRRQLKGNIYLAKVTRVEPSLQAAFVEYGGNRHGFLAFNEIHPDYYQIPIADRERLLAEQAAAEREAENDREGEDAEADAIVADEDEDVERRRARLSSRYYKIQEVIKRRQIMLVQVAKEERGNKGAALTTYLSLAGRYCVLMPNTSRGGGISRKIAGITDRKRLKKIIAELDVPEGMAVIVRTAGAGRGKAEIKRDYEYLVRLWSSIREMTLQSTAPTLVYEEASLIKRSIRDLYGRDIAEIIVQGEEEYRIAKEFMKLFLSSHAKRVKLYEEAEKPLFQQFGVEDLLDSMHQPSVHLRSGGYIVINPTEALVSIDVNSGRSTRERNIEETALRTNLEAADEIARQLRLRDLAGLIVIDFIDMENPRNQGTVERRLKEAMKNDRARVQIGRISPFGLLELSRQRLRPSLIETCFELCPACGGNGLRRTTESTSRAILRKLEAEGIKRRVGELAVTVPASVATYLLNQKRRSLVAIEGRYGLSVAVIGDSTLVPPDHRIDRLRPVAAKAEEEAAEVEQAEVEPADDAVGAAADRDEASKRGRRRRVRRKRRSDEEGQTQREVATAIEAEEESEVEEEDLGAEVPELASEESAEQSSRKRRRRGKRGGRRRPQLAPGQPSETEMGVATVVDLDQAEESVDFIAADEVEAETPEPLAMQQANGGDDGKAETLHSRRRSRHQDTRKGASREVEQDAFAADAEDAAAATMASAYDYATEEPEQAREDFTRQASPTGGEEEPTSDETLTSRPQEAIDITVIGGARPAIEEPTTDEAQANAEETDSGELPLPAEAAPLEVMADDQQRPAAEDNAEVVVVGEARRPLPADGGDEETRRAIESLQVPILEHGADSDAPREADRDHSKAEVGPSEDAPVVPADSSEPRANASHPSPDDLEHLPKARRTEVIHVGEHDERDEGGPRRGWWQRLLS
jgi:ribonuclease E